jgi:hypothetical protein
MNVEKRALVKNAGSEKQVKDAEIKQELSQDKEHNDLLFVLDTEQGRRVMWRILSHAGIYKSPYNHSGSVQNMNIGMGEVARWLLAQIVNVDETKWLQMQSENLRKGEINV